MTSRGGGETPTCDWLRSWGSRWCHRNNTAVIPQPRWSGNLSLLSFVWHAAGKGTVRDANCGASSAALHRLGYLLQHNAPEKLLVVTVMSNITSSFIVTSADAFNAGPPSRALYMHQYPDKSRTETRWFSREPSKWLHVWWTEVWVKKKRGNHVFSWWWFLCLLTSSTEEMTKK